MIPRTSWRYFSYLSQRSDGIGYDHGGGVREKVLEKVKEALILNQLSVDVVKLSHTHGSCLTNIGIIILQKERYYRRN